MTTPRYAHGTLISAALDPHRRAVMLQAIEQTLQARPNASVALLGWEAATLLDAVAPKASRVLIFEQDPELAKAIEHGIINAGLGAKVTLMNQDPTSARLEQRVDVAVATLSSTWFIGGQEAELINNAHANLLKTSGVMIPRRAVHLFELSAAPNQAGPLALRAPRFSRPGEPVAVLSEAKHFLTQTFAQGALPSAIDDTIYVKPLLSGTITGLRIKTLYELADNVVQVTSASGVQAILVPLREDIRARANQPVSIHIRYEVGEGLSGVQFSGRALAHEATNPISEAQRPALEQFKGRVFAMIEELDRKGRGADLDRVVSYTIQPHGDVSRLTALFWTIDDEFHKPLSDILDAFRREVTQHGAVPDDETIYQMMLEVWKTKRGQ